MGDSVTVSLMGIIGVCAVLLGIVGIKRLSASSRRRNNHRDMILTREGGLEMSARTHGQD